MYQLPAVVGIWHRSLHHKSWKHTYVLWQKHGECGMYVYIVIHPIIEILTMGLHEWIDGRWPAWPQGRWQVLTPSEFVQNWTYHKWTIWMKKMAINNGIFKGKPYLCGETSLKKTQFCIKSMPNNCSQLASGWIKNGCFLEVWRRLIILMRLYEIMMIHFVPAKITESNNQW